MQMFDLETLCWISGSEGNNLGWDTLKRKWCVPTALSISLQNYHIPLLYNYIIIINITTVCHLFVISLCYSPHHLSSFPSQFLYHREHLKGNWICDGAFWCKEESSGSKIECLYQWKKMWHIDLFKGTVKSKIKNHIFFPGLQCCLSI